MKSSISFLSRAIAITVLTALLSQPQSNVFAAANLTVTPLTWNVIGLDSNNVNVGPNHFPIGARVCNTGDAIATNVKSSFVWDSSDPYINLRPGTFSAYTANGINLNPGACTDFYYEVEVTRNSSAYNHTRRYHITATADGGLTGSTPTPRELYVEHLVSQSRNTVSDVKLDGVSIPNGGTMSLIVGNTYTIQLIGSTATNGYEQIESFINFPNTIFQILSVATTYTAETSTSMTPPYDKLYGDACVWENDINSPNYRACNTVGKAGGNITVTYQVRILQAPSAPLVNPEPLSTLIYDFSGSSYHYNADYGISTRYAYIFDPSAITISKNFNPDPTIVNGISTLTFTITNPTTVAVSGLNFNDPFPTTPGAMVVANPTNASTSGCGSPTFAPAAGAASLSFSNGTVAANGTCTITVNVTVPVTGTYNNTSSHLFINSLDTGNSANDTLTVNSAPVGPAPVCGLSMAQWMFSGFTANPPPFPSADTQASNVTTAAINVGNGLVAESDTTTSGGNPQPGIRLYGWQKTAPIITATSAYIQFAIDTTKYTQINLQFDAQRKANGPGSDEIYYSTDGVLWTLESTFASTTSWATYGAYDFTGQTSTTGVTYFRIYGYGANATSSGNDLNLDNVNFTGCAQPVPPTITKAFSPDPIAVNGTSTLTFTLSNSNSIALTGVSFSDTLPIGLQVAGTPSASTTCVGSPTWAPTASDTSMTFGSPTGGSIPANSSCTVSVNITGTASGSYQNVSGFISSTNGGTNIGSTGSATASLTVLKAPTIAKLFSPNPILVNGTSTLTFTLTNPNINNALAGVAFSDTYPGGVVNTNPLVTTNSCGGTLTATAGGGDVNLGSVSIAAGESCTVTINVTSSTAGSYANTSGAVSSTNGGMGNTASNTLTVNSPNPAIALLKQISTSATGPWTSYVTVNAGTNVFYKFTVENIGDVMFSPISVSDPTVSTASCSWPASLAVAVSGNENHIATCVVGPIAATTGSHTNTAAASGTYGGIPYTSTSSSARYATPAITLVKSAAETSFTLVGDVIHYSYLVTNSGFAPLLGPVTVTDDKTTVTCPDVSTVEDNDNYFDPGESLTCTSTYTIILADLVAGSVTNTASASAGGVTSNTATKTVYRSIADLIISKANNVSGSIALGNSFTWTITVNNTGVAAATFATGDVIFTDSLPGVAGYYPQGSLTVTNGAIAPVGTIDCSISGTTLNCLASGLLVTLPVTGSFSTSFNVSPTAAGSLVNTATVDPNNTVLELNETNNSSTDTVTVVAPSVIAKNFSPDPIGVGGTTTLTFTITNPNAGTTLTGVGFTDSLPTGLQVASAPNVLISAGCNSPTFAPIAGDTSLTITGGTILANGTCTISVDVTATSVGSKNNTTGAVTSTNGGTGNTAADTLTVVSPPSITKNFSPDPIFVNGISTLTFNLTNSNTGNSLIGVAFTDSLPAGLQVASTPNASTSACGASTFAPSAGDTTLSFSGGTIAAGGTCTISVDVIATTSGVKNNTTGNVTSTNGGTGNTANDTLTVNPLIDVSLDKQVSNATPNVSATITFTLVIANAGPSTATNVVVTDVIPGGYSYVAPSIAGGDSRNDSSPGGSGLTWTINSLASGASVNLTYQVTVLASGVYDNYGEITSHTETDIDSTPNNGSTMEDDDDTETVTPVPVIDVSLDKQVSNSTPSIGGTVTFTLVVANAGPGTATNVVVTDAILGGYAYVAASIAGGDSRNDGSPSGTGLSWTINSLAPSASVNLTYQAVVLTSGPYNNYAEITSHTQTDSDSTPGNASINEDDDDTETVTPLNPSLNIVKEVGVTSSGPWNDTSVTVNAGDTVFYRIRVANIGNTILTNLVVDDGMAGCTLTRGTDLTGDNDTDFEVGEEWLYTCSVTAFAGTNNNTATADTVETPQDSDKVSYFGNNPAFTLTKVANVASVNAAGNVVVYTVTLTNTGNLTLTGVSVSDLVLANLDCDGTTGAPFTTTGLSIAIAGSLTCTGSYTVTQADLDNNGGGDGDIDNTVTGDTNETLPQAANAAVAIVRSLSHTTVKTQTSVGPYVVGNTITYNIVVTNTGNVTLTGVTVVDGSAMVGICTPSQPSNLALSATMTCPASHVVNQADVDNGSYVNTATGASNETPSSDSSVTVNFTQNPSLNVVKEVATAAGGPWNDNSVTVNVGDTVYFRIRVANIGNITLTNLSVDDGMAGCTLVRGTDLTGDNDNAFEVGEEWLYTCSLSAVSGTNNNTATADSAETPQDSDGASYTGNVISAPAMDVVKDGTLDLTLVAPNGRADAGDVINYTVSVQNTGNVILTGVAVSDPLLGNLDCDGTSGVPFTTSGLTISVATTLTCSGSYTLTQNDLDTNGGGDGDIDNTATADSNETGPDSDPNEESLLLTPAIQVDKALNSATFNSPNEVRLTYTITVQNTGNVTLSNLQITDDLVAAFPGAASFTVISLTSADFTINPGFNGNSDIDLLNGIDSLAAGGSGSLSLIVDVDTGGDEDFYINTAVGAGDSPDGSTVQDTGVAGAPGFVDPALAKTANVSQASVGDTVIFTITVTNQGNVAAPNVIVTDTLPAMFDVTAVNITVTGPVLVPVVNVTPAIGVGPSPYTVTVNNGTLEVTNVVTIQIVTTVNSLGNPPIVNNAGLTTTAATNNLLNDNDSVTITLGIGPATALSLPATGFAPGRETILASQPAELQYAVTEVILEIPRLGVKMPIVGVPFKNGGWDVSWLGNQAGWLEGSAFPSWSGNSVLTGHVYSATGSPGPFMNLRTLSYGDQVIIHANGQKYIFEIRSNSIVLPNDSSAFKHEELSWLTLITCKEFDPATNSYKKRVLVRAVLVSVE